MNWIKRIFGSTQKRSYVEIIRSNFHFLEEELGYSSRIVLDPDSTDQKMDYYVLEYSHKDAQRSIHIGAPVKNRENLKLIVYNQEKPENISIRDVHKYLPIESLKAFFSPSQYNSSDYIGQLVGLDILVQNLKTVILENKALFSGNQWIDRKVFDMQLYEMGIYRYPKSEDQFAFIDAAKKEFDFLVNDFSYHLEFSADALPAYTNYIAQEISYSNNELDSYISLSYDLRELTFELKLFNYEDGKNGAKSYEVFSAINLQGIEGFGFLKKVASDLKQMIIA
jgi:hypothetical protein